MRPPELWANVAMLEQRGYAILTENQLTKLFARLKEDGDGGAGLHHQFRLYRWMANRELIIWPRAHLELRPSVRRLRRVGKPINAPHATGATMVESLLLEQAGFEALKLSIPLGRYCLVDNRVPRALAVRLNKD